MYPMCTHKISLSWKIYIDKQRDKNDPYIFSFITVATGIEVVT
jgi:hypothetical protein